MHPFTHLFSQSVSQSVSCSSSNHIICPYSSQQTSQNPFCPAT